jgi:hypothetical protein
MEIARAIKETEEIARAQAQDKAREISSTPEVRATDYVAEYTLQPYQSR